MLSISFFFLTSNIDISQNLAFGLSAPHPTWPPKVMPFFPGATFSAYLLTLLNLDLSSDHQTHISNFPLDILTWLFSGFSKRNSFKGNALPSLHHQALPLVHSDIFHFQTCNIPFQSICSEGIIRLSLSCLKQFNGSPQSTR